MPRYQVEVVVLKQFEAVSQSKNSSSQVRQTALHYKQLVSLLHFRDITDSQAASPRGTTPESIDPPPHVRRLVRVDPPNDSTDSTDIRHWRPLTGHPPGLPWAFLAFLTNLAANGPSVNRYPLPVPDSRRTRNAQSFCQVSSTFQQQPRLLRSSRRRGWYVCTSLLSSQFPDWMPVPNEHIHTYT